uniref:Roundabout guidance receptor 3 n=1 Tax=Anolis carolinensis TaxID=28377 RepID=A0A803TPZ8_ANOCA|nr:PREDICTED: roundabout homolog 3 isoform X2 [Anolis carolinensis]|eukprot:XP_016852268.1 PREDICTED: roundabout homolog 3 isoform X2 [Anolis carolinensis]
MRRRRLPLWLRSLLSFLLGLAAGSRPRLEDSSPRIIEHPSDLIVSKGEPATLNCKAEGRPTPIVEWYKDGERVETDKEDPRSHRMLLPSGSLFFLRIVHGRRSKPDEGVYVCVARNYLGEAVSRNASLEVAILRDDFRQAPSDVVVAAGEPAVMECIPPRGHPEPTISWKKNNVRITDKDERITIRGGKLMMSNTRKSDAGMYICVATNMVGERDSEPAELVVFERPTFIKRPINQVVLAEDTVNFQCEVQGDPVPTSRWRKEEGDLPRGRSEVQNDNSLRISRVSAEDEGTYTCVAENSVGKSEASGSLSVHVGPFLPPQLVTRPRDQIVTQGRTVTFQCETKGNPPPAVFWQKEGSQILLFPSQPPQAMGRFSVSPSGEMTITDAQTSDSGYYMCQAISVAGSILAKALLEVEDVTSDRIPPIIRRGPTNQTLAVDSTAQLQCHVNGNPLPSIQWLKDGERIVGSDPRISLLDNGTLQIMNLQISDSGLYVCIATSSTGETRWSGFLAVQENGGDLQIQLPESNLLPGPPSAPLVTDVTKNSVALIWKPSPVSGGAPVSSYIIEAFSQSSGSTWQTVADNVKLEKHTVSGLNPNTIYLFLIRAVNTYGLSDPSPVSEPVRTQDVSPTRQGVDHRQVQRELGEVVVQLQDPIVLTSTTIQVTWTVDRQAQFIQGYRVMYRTRGSAWLVQDVKSPTERSTILVDLSKGQEYEIKIRPYFDEFQGMDSEVLLVRTPEEVPSAPPQAVTVVMLGTSNSTSISISWEPPPPTEQNGIIQDYQIWCLGNESRYHINKTVDGTVHSTVLLGLVPGMVYRTEVAAATRAGVGVRSAPVTIQIKPLPDQDTVSVSNGDSVSLAEQITDVVKQPAFIAGIGGACWVILMCFSVWIYCRRKKRKELSHYTASFAYTPAVSFPHMDGASRSSGSRPGMLAMATSASSYPWLAESWPGPNLLRNGKTKEPGVTCCPGNHNATERYYNDAGISNYIAQTEKFGTGVSDGPIYSTIDPASDDMRTFNGGFSQHTTPYATTPVMPYGATHLHSPDEEESQWITQPGIPSIQYAQPERSRAEPVAKPMKQKSMGKPVKTPSLNWTEVLPPPPSASELSQYVEEEEGEEEEEVEVSSEVGEWCPPLPERTYLMENIQEEACPPPPPRGDASSPANSYGQQSTVTLTPSPREEIRASEDIPRLHHFEIPHLPRRQPNGSGPFPRASSPPLTQSNPNLNMPEEGPEGITSRQGHRRNLSQTPGHNAENVDSSGIGKPHPNLGDMPLPPGEKGKGKKKSKSSHYRREKKQGDLPPPPLPPPEEDLGSSAPDSTSRLDCDPSALEKDLNGSFAMERKVIHRTMAGQHYHQHKEEEEIIPYSKPSFLSRSQMSSNCSTTGSSSSRGSTASRGHGSGRSRTTGERSEEKR